MTLSERGATSSRRARPSRRQRVLAAACLVFLLAAGLLIIDLSIRSFPWGLVLAAAISLAAVSAWYGVLGAGPARFLGLVFAALIIALTTISILLYGEGFVQALEVLALLALAAVAGRDAMRIRIPLPAATAPQRPVLFLNPKSGGGKAERFGLAEEARSRGIEPIELTREDDLEQLVRTAVAGGADGLAMAGGDGSQAVVASIAAELELPYACIPAGTRNHFALDLGVDREDCVGALDAFVDGGLRKVDLGRVNGRVFVNNVSLGLYAEAVQRKGYREAKLRTLVATVPEMLGPDGSGLDLTWTGPSGREHTSGVAILVSNNQYRLGRAIGSGTRPRIDDGRLGITVLATSGIDGDGVGPQKPWREWDATEFEVLSEQPVAAGIDGEAATLESPLRFEIMPLVLTVHIARQHPGSSPSASIPEGLTAGFGALIRITAGRYP